MNKHKEGVSPLLTLSSWGAGKSGYSYTHFYVYDDGDFVKEEGSSNNQPITTYQGFKILTTKNEESVYKGTLSKEQLDTLLSYLDENIKESSTKTMFDAGYRVTYLKNNTSINIENDMEIYNSITKLIPYKVGTEE